MPRMKFGIKGAGVESTGGDFYQGDPPPKGTYQFKLKRLQVKETGPQSKNPGTPMLVALLEVVGPKSAKKYFGAGIFRNLVISEAAAGFVNQFLNSLTDGSETSMKRIQKAFWDDGPFVDKEGHVTKIGTLKIDSPEGERTLTAMTKMGKYNGETKAEIARFLVPVGGSTDLDDEEADREADEADDEDLEDEIEFDESDEDDDEDDESDEEEDEDEEDESDSDEDEEDDEEEDEPAPAAKKKAKGKAPF